MKNKSLLERNVGPMFYGILAFCLMAPLLWSGLQQSGASQLAQSSDSGYELLSQNSSNEQSVPTSGRLPSYYSAALEPSSEEKIVEAETEPVPQLETSNNSKSEEEPIYLESVPEPDRYHRVGTARTAMLRAARQDAPELKGSLFYQPMIVTDGQDACIISVAKASPDSESIYTIAQLTLQEGYWKRWNYATTTDASELINLVETELSDGTDQVETIAYKVATQYQSINTETAALDDEYSRYSGATPNVTPDTEASTERLSSEIDNLYALRMQRLESEIRLANLLQERELRRDVYVGYSYKPSVAENGSYYGQISERTYRPRTTYVNGYFRGNGTYVRSHFRSRREP